MKKTINYQLTDKERLDKFLTDQFPELSRNQIQKMIKAGNVLVNDTKAAVHKFLKTGDKLTVETFAEEIDKPAIDFKPKIIFENDHCLVLDKPSGLAVEGSSNEFCLIDWLKSITPETGDEEFDKRHGLIHRLDKDVSGVMLIAKTPEFFYHLKAQFKKRTIKKIYYGLVCGRFEKDEGRLDYIMARGREGKMAARPLNQEGKQAVTEYEVIKRFNNYTYLKIKILTGRTHQIRVHFFAFNHPIAGDKLYSQKKIKDPAGLERLFLHSYQIGFYDLDNQWQEYQADLPESLNNLLSTLK